MNETLTFDAGWLARAWLAVAEASSKDKGRPMLEWQCEFGDCARRIRLSITKRLGAKKSREYVDHFLGRRAS